MNAYLRILLTLVISFAFIAAFSYVVEEGQKRFHVHKYGRVKEIYENATRFDILFLGSSRTHGGIYPMVIDSITGLKSYNGGVEGGNLYEFKLTLDGYLVHHPSPKLVVLTIDPGSFDIDRKMFFPVQYFHNLGNPVLKKAFRVNKEYKYIVIRYLPMMRLLYYDDYGKSLAFRGLLGSNEVQQQPGTIEGKGFLSPGNGILDPNAGAPFPSSSLRIETEGVQALRGIVDTCKARNIRLVFAYAPEFKFSWQRSFVNFPDFLDTVNSIATQNRISYFRDDSLSMCQDPRYFVGYGHVNTHGAIEYSKILGKRIAYLLKEE